MARNPFPMSPEAKRLLALVRESRALSDAHWANVRKHGLGDADRAYTKAENKQWDTTGIPMRAHGELCNEAAAKVLFRVRAKGYRPHARDLATLYLASWFIPRCQYDVVRLTGHLIGADKFEPSRLPKHEHQCWAPYVRRAKPKRQKP